MLDFGFSNVFVKFSGGFFHFGFIGFHFTYFFPSLFSMVFYFFSTLLIYVYFSQELVERIDDDVEQAVSHADRAHSILLQTYEKVSSNKALYTKIFFILALFILFFTLFLM